MAATFRIVIKNRSDENQEFVLFSETPRSATDNDRAYTAVWARTPAIAPGSGTASVEIKQEYYAVCGVAPGPLTADLQVSPSDSQPVKLATESAAGTECLLKVVDGGAQFDHSQQGTTVRQRGYFGIKSDPFDGRQYKNAWCGVGLKTQDDNISPVAVWPARPNFQNLIGPKPVYYVAMGRYEPGHLVDVVMLGSVCKVDFSEGQSTTCTVTYNIDGTYKPVFG